MFQNGTSGNVLNYQPDVTTAQDYDPFGMLLEGRNWAAGSEYKYGFNGKENDDEIAGNNNALDFGARIYDARIARFMCVDFAANKFPHLSPYNFASNNPIGAIDKNGDSTVYVSSTGAVLLTSFSSLTNAVVVIADVSKFKFNVHRIINYYGIESIDGDLTDASFRRFGEAYLIDEFFKMDDAYKQYWGETATWLDKDANGAYFPKLDDPSIMDRNENANNTILDEKEAPIANGPRAHLHSTTPYSDGDPSDHDYAAHQSNKEGYNVVMGNVGKFQDGRRMVLYNHNGDPQSTDISIRRDAISISKDKPVKDRVPIYNKQ